MSAAPPLLKVPRKEKNSMAMESLSSNRASAAAAANHHHQDDDNDDPLTSSAVRARSSFGLGLPSFGLDEEITATRLLADHLRPPKLFEVASLLPEDLDDPDSDPDPEADTEEEIVTSVIRRPVAENDEASVDDDPEIVDVIALDAIKPRAVATSSASVSTVGVPPPLPLRLPRILPPPVQDHTVFLGTPRKSYKSKRPSHINMDEAARAALKARLEEVAAAVRRREIDFGAAADTDVIATAPLPLPLPFLAPPAPPFADGGWPLLPWGDNNQEQPPQQHAFVAPPKPKPQQRVSAAKRKEQQANSIAMGGIAVLMIAGLIMGLSMMRPKTTYNSSCTVFCLR
jgi:hypothetical protein